MSENEVITLSLGIGELLTFAAVIVSIVVFQWTRRKDSLKRAEQDGATRTLIETMKDKLNDMSDVLVQRQSEITDLTKGYATNTADIRNVKEIAVKAQESANAAHNRIDKLGGTT